MTKNITTLKNKRFLFIVLALFCSFLFFVSSFFGVGVASADVVTEDNKYYYTGSNFYVPLTYGSTVNMVNFECDLYPYERSILIGDESLRRNLVMPVFSAFSDVKTLPYAVEYGGETYLPDNDGSLSFSNYDRYVNYDSNNLPVDVTSSSQLTDNTYAEKIVYLVDNQIGGGATPMSLSFNDYFNFTSSLDSSFVVTLNGETLSHNETRIYDGDIIHITTLNSYYALVINGIEINSCTLYSQDNSVIDTFYYSEDIVLTSVRKNTAFSLDITIEIQSSLPENSLRGTWRFNDVLDLPVAYEGKYMPVNYAFLFDDIMNGSMSEKGFYFNDSNMPEAYPGLSSVWCNSGGYIHYNTFYGAENSSGFVKGWRSDDYKTFRFVGNTISSSLIYDWVTSNAFSLDSPEEITYTIPKGYYIVKDNPTLPTERLNIIFQLQDGEAIESIFTGNNNSLAYTPFNNDSYIVYNPTTGWTNSYKRIWVLANDVILNESAYQWFTENVSLYQPVERNTIKFQSQLGFNANVVSVQFTHDLGLSFDGYTTIENKVIYTDSNGYKFIITFYSDFDNVEVQNIISRFAFENRTYYLGNALNGDGNYQLGYDEGYSEGYDKGFILGNEQFTTETQDAIDSAYNSGKTYGESLGYSKGWQDATDNEFTAGNFFSKVMSIFDVKIFGAFSMSEVFVVVLGLSLVIIVLKIFAGG